MCQRSQEPWGQLTTLLPSWQFRSPHYAFIGPHSSPAATGGGCESQTALRLPWATHLLAHVVVGQVDNRAKPLQHVEDHLPVTALAPRGGERGRLEEGVGSGPSRVLRVGTLGGPYLEKCHFADDVIVHIDGEVHPHLIWKLHHQL